MAKSNAERQRLRRQRLAHENLSDVTVTVPIEWVTEFRSIAAFCCEHREYFPFMVRSSTTGKMKKGI